ncbi:hypothetical protein, partial [Pedobacter gandavensis]|uniref:hypothetical protein n=1 Tax=Pedobacter gandavensis TaxID=2679963 RepID=UPI002930FBE7
WKVSLSSITPLNSKFFSIKSGRNNLSNDAVADGINIKLYKIQSYIFNASSTSFGIDPESLTIYSENWCRFWYPRKSEKAVNHAINSLLYVLILNLVIPLASEPSPEINV